MREEGDGWRRQAHEMSLSGRELEWFELIAETDAELFLDWLGLHTLLPILELKVTNRIRHHSPREKRMRRGQRT